VTDSLAPRGKFAVLAPSTNTSVQPEFDAMRPWGVTNHHSRLIIPDTRVTDDRSFMVMMDTIRAALFPALESALSCDPDYVVLGMSSETFWDGVEGSEKLKRKLKRVAKRGVAMGSDACRAALRAYGRGIKRLGVVTPYMPVGDRQVLRFFTECGYQVVNLLGLIDSSTRTTGTRAAGGDPLYDNYVWQSPSELFEHQPTMRVDYNLSQDNRLNGSFSWIRTSRTIWRPPPTARTTRGSGTSKSNTTRITSSASTSTSSRRRSRARALVSIRSSARFAHRTSPRRSAR